MSESHRVLAVRGTTAAARALAPAALEAASGSELAVDAVESQTAALERFEQAGDAEPSVYDAVVTAQELADGTGIELTERIHERHGAAGLPVVLAVYDGDETTASAAVSADVSEYVSVPRTDESGADGGVVGTDARGAEAVARRLRAVLVGESSGPGSERSGGGTRTSPIEKLTDEIDDALWLFSPDWEQLLFVNETYEDIWGHSTDRLRRDPTAFLGAVHPEDRPTVERGVERLAAGETVEIEIRVQPEESEQRWLRIRGAPIRGEDGEIRMLGGFSRDVTERKRRQRRLEEQRRFVTSVFDALPDALYAFDTDGFLIRWNEQLEAVTGYGESEIDGMYVTDFVPTDEIETIATSFQRILEHGESVTVESAFEAKGGERIPFEFTGAPLADADGELRGVTGIGRDISARRERQRRFEAVFENTYQFTGLMAPDGTILEANRAALEFGDLDRDQLVGNKLWEADFFQIDEHAREVARTAVDQASAGEFFREQLRVQGANREAIIDFSVRPVHDEDGAVELLIPEGRDITPLEQRERQLEVTNRFLRHNIRNKLTTIRGHAELLGKDATQTEPSREQIMTAADELAETAELAREINDLVQREPDRTKLNLVDVVTDAAETVEADSPEATVTVETPLALLVTAVPTVGDAVVELLSTLLARDGANPDVSVTVAGDDDVGRIVVESGAALSEAERAVLTGEIEIDPLTHAEGLGLWYVYWLVQFSGGTITVEGDDGCTVTVVVPRE